MISSQPDSLSMFQWLRTSSRKFMVRDVSCVGVLNSDGQKLTKKLLTIS